MSTIEHRALSTSALEIRKGPDGKSPHIVGIIPYNQLSQDLGGYVERISPSAFTRTLNARSDVYAFWGHDEKEILGSSAAGTMTLESRPDGLHFDILAPTSAANRIESIQRGDASGVSFGFITDPNGSNYDMTGPETIRTLTSVHLLEISVGVAFAAYPSAHAETALRKKDNGNTGEIDALRIELALFGA